jgi:hypothetical protein
MCTKCGLPSLNALKAEAEVVRAWMSQAAQDGYFRMKVDQRWTYQPVQIIDSRDNEERTIAQIAKLASAGPACDKVVEVLTGLVDEFDRLNDHHVGAEIARWRSYEWLKHHPQLLEEKLDEYRPERRTASQEEKKHRAKEIGRVVDAAGGFRFMQYIAYRVLARTPEGYILDRIFWNGVGQWMG